MSKFIEVKVMSHFTGLPYALIINVDQIISIEPSCRGIHLSSDQQRELTEESFKKLLHEIGVRE